MTTAREIIQLGNPLLRRISEDVTDVQSAETKALIADMQTTLAGTQGVGIAAPQIGEAKRIIIIASRPTPRYPNAPDMHPTVMINPKFAPVMNIKEKDWEGCLSIPGIRARVPRFTHIKIDYLDETGSKMTNELSDFIARVFQHEYDHLEGRVYLDSIETTYDIMTEMEYRKLF
jgi:peptide deformylase